MDGAQIDMIVVTNSYEGLLHPIHNYWPMKYTLHACLCLVSLFNKSHGVRNNGTLTKKHVIIYIQH